MSKIAQQISKNDATTAATEAEAKAVAKDNIWEGEGYTIYVFDDNSVLVQSGSSQLAVDADDKTSVEAYVKFLGDDAKYDKQRIDDMMAAAV